MMAVGDMEPNRDETDNRGVVGPSLRGLTPFRKAAARGASGTISWKRDVKPSGS